MALIRLNAQLLQFTRRLLEGRPVLLLLGIEHQPGAERSQARGLEGADIVDRGLPAALRIALAAARLGIGQGRAGNGQCGGGGEDGFQHWTLPGDGPKVVLSGANNSNPTRARGKLKFGHITSK